LLLVGGLVYLFFESQPGELKRQSQVSSALRQLREIDTGWDRHVATARNEPVSADASASTGTRLEVLLDQLRQDAAALGSDDLTSGLATLEGAFQQKQALFDQFTAAQAALRDGLRGTLDQITQLRQAATSLAQAHSAAQPRLATLDSQLVSLQSELLRLSVQPDASARTSLQRSAAELAAQSGALPDELRAGVTSLLAPLGGLLSQEGALTQLREQLALAPTGPRVNAMTNAFDRQFQAIADHKEQYRVYLVFYSAALLVFLAYVLWQLGQSYAKINQANDALKAANENLEHKVEERTKELSQALKHLKESELLLVQTEKMSSLGQMVAGIAHEINTPLAYVKSSIATLRERIPAVDGVVNECQKLLTMLERGDAPDEELAAQFTRVSTHAATFEAESSASDLSALSGDALHGIEQISEIILNLKNFSRLDRSKVSRFNLNDGLESTLVIARNMVKHKRVTKRLGEIPLIECSPSQINQVFLNLVTNAAQATADQTGEIVIATSATPNGQVRVDIGDNGHGIPENILAKVFDPFFTTKEVGQGTGLGLSIAYKIVQEHGGRIEVKSKVGQGTIFSVFLPVQATQPSQALAA
jgi:signal transduction histidine kinase